MAAFSNDDDTQGTLSYGQRYTSSTDTCWSLPFDGCGATYPVFRTVYPYRGAQGSRRAVRRLRLTQRWLRPRRQGPSFASIRSRAKLFRETLRKRVTARDWS